VELSDEQRQVLDCLQKAATGLTTRQLESRLCRNRDSLEGVLSELMERQLVSRLNTLIPSYAYRRAGSRADTE
jgi:predicted transcriptional regulator